jgi:hypothetical protein
VAFWLYFIGDILTTVTSTIAGPVIFGIGHLVYASPLIFCYRFYADVMHRIPTTTPSNTRRPDVEVPFKTVMSLGAMFFFVSVMLLVFVIAEINSHSISGLLIAGSLIYGLVLGLAHLKSDILALVPILKPASIGYLLFVLSDALVFYMYCTGTKETTSTRAFIMSIYWTAISFISVEEVLRYLFS